MRTYLLTGLCFWLSGASAQTTVSGTIQSGGLTRDYRLYIPAAYTGNTAVPLVLNLHGYSSNNIEQEFYANFKPIADTADFLIVHPNGTQDGQGNRFWNTFGTGSTVNDVGFLSDLIDDLKTKYNIDPNRIYSTGMSNGGFMSYSLACELNDRIAAIASVTGSMIESKLSACQPKRPVPVMEIHGTADNTVPYDGTILSGFVPIPKLVKAWVEFNYCNPTPIVMSVPDIDPSDDCTAEHYLYTGGINGSTVEHYKIIGGEHTWPGAFFNIGITNQDINACREIWRFFSQYRLDLLSPVTTPEAAENSWTLFPNPAQDQVSVLSAGEQPADRIRVYDALGRLQQTLVPTGNPVDIATGAWSDGVYFLSIEKDGITRPLRLVKN